MSDKEALFILEIFSWIAVLSLSFGYWKQIWHIHVHREVRDLSLSSYFFFLFTYIVLCIKGYVIHSEIFFWKNLLVAIQTMIIIFQIIKNQESTWRGKDEYKKMKESLGTKEAQRLHKLINLRAKNSKDKESSDDNPII